MSVNLLFSENSILKQAQSASEKTAYASAKEAMETSVVSCQITFIGDDSSSGSFSEWLTTEKLNDELKKSGYYLCESKTDSTEKASDSELAVGGVLYFTATDNQTTIFEIILQIGDDGNTIAVVDVSDVENAESSLGDSESENEDGEQSGDQSDDENDEQSDDQSEEQDGEQNEDENSENNEPVSAEDIASDAGKYYGSLTDYSIDGSSTKWEILYSSGTNIYLIATDYISIDECPSSSLLKERDTKYMLSFTNLSTVYSGSSDINLKSLNSSYFNQGYTSENENMKAVAFMLDTTVWNKFKNEYAAYSIGGPTVEMLFSSYNQVYETNYSAKAVSEVGYQISSDGENYVSEIDNAFETESPYVISDHTKASAMWVASPSADASNALIRVSYWGSVGIGYTYYDYPGFRPVVCLLTDVSLRLNENGVYEIQ